MRKLLIIVYLGILIQACNTSPYPGFYRFGKGNVFYRMVALGDSIKHPNEQDVLYLQYQVKGLHSEKSKSEKSVFRLNTVIQDQLSGALMSMNEGDSAEFILPRDLVEGALLTSELLEESTIHDSILKLGVRINKVEPAREFEQKKKQFMDWLFTQDADKTEIIRQQKLLKDYIASSDFQPDVTSPTGLVVRKDTKSGGKEIDYGRTVRIHYEGFFLDGRKFESTYDRKMPLEFVYGQEFQVIKGLEEGLSYLKAKEKGTILIPSYLAYGEQGSSTGIIPPETPLIYEVEVLIVN